MKIWSNNNFTAKLPSKLLVDLYIGVHLKGTKKFDIKVIKRQYFHRKTGLKPHYIFFPCSAVTYNNFFDCKDIHSSKIKKKKMYVR